MHIPKTFPYSPISNYSPIPIQNWVMGAHGGHVMRVTQCDTTGHAVFVAAREKGEVRGRGLLITSIVLSSFAQREGGDVG